MGIASTYISYERKVMFSPGSKRTLLVFIILGQLMFSASVEAASNSDYKVVKARHLDKAPSDRIEPLTNLSKLDPEIEIQVADLASVGKFNQAPESFVLMATSGWINAGGCTYRQAVDNPHLSSGTTSVHGWWETWAFSGCPNYSNVDTYLQAFFCNMWGCSYITIASDSRDVLAGGGSGRRGNARNSCVNSSLISYRGAVDVDLISQSDPGGLTYSPEVGVNCYPA